jgi:hypothetical protein
VYLGVGVQTTGIRCASVPIFCTIPELNGAVFTTRVEQAFTNYHGCQLAVPVSEVMNQCYNSVPLDLWSRSSQTVVTIRAEYEGLQGTLQGYQQRFAAPDAEDVAFMTQSEASGHPGRSLMAEGSSTVAFSPISVSTLWTIMSTVSSFKEATSSVGSVPVSKKQMPIPVGETECDIEVHDDAVGAFRRRAEPWH